MNLKEKRTQKNQEKASVCLNSVFNTKDDIEHKSNLLLERVGSLKAKVEILESKINSAMKLEQDLEANRYFDQRESTLQEIGYLEGDVKTYESILLTIDKWAVVLKGFFAHQQYKEIIKQVPANKLASLVEKDALIGQINDFVIKGYNKTLERKRVMELGAKQLNKSIRKALDSDKTYDEVNNDIVEEERRKKEMEAIANKYAQVVVPEKASKKAGVEQTNSKR